MKCCEKCFKDEELLAILKTNGSIGTCEVCGAVRVLTCDSDLVLDEIASLMDCYVPYDPKNPVHLACKGREGALPDLFLRDTNIFALSASQLSRLIERWSRDEVGFAKAFISQVDLLIQQGSLKDCILPNADWLAFEESIKYKSRFNFTPGFDEKVLRRAIGRCGCTLERGQLFSRARKTTGGKCYGRKDMFPPPREKCVSGRFNPSGIRVLYLANDEQTAIAEMRPKVKDRFCVAKFALKKKVKILDLRKICTISPFGSEDSQLFYLTNYGILKRIEAEFSRVVDGMNNDLDYLISQYICDVIRRCGWKGVLYHSTLNKGGENLALFSSEDAKMRAGTVKIYEVQSSSHESRLVME